MFTPSMTEEEIQQAAYKDYLEIRTRVQIAFERFGQSMRISGKHKRAIHSLSESHTLCTRAKNTWNVNFRYTAIRRTVRLHRLLPLHPLATGERGGLPFYERP